MDKTSYDEWKATREVLEKVTRSLEKTLNSAEYLQRAGQEYVGRYSRATNRSELSASTGSGSGSGSEEIQEAKQNIDTRSEKWRKLLFQKKCPVQFENEPHWYKVLQRYRPSRSLYDGLGANTPVKVDESVQTDFTFVRKCYVLGMESFEKEEKTSGVWKMCCCGRQ
ncbi:hypothetical protein KP79_PYT08597 [Mizuhopecten yessoensis]|uniref:Uncharacterized protein n=1 Tax=Mizuhopecten yessoensis TaxID=6573 RepID=A0A210Q2F6_MIZYE|nr:hypothetical protein KP79_PYT08597 [Mizuhopecten yessoensis]